MLRRPVVAALLLAAVLAPASPAYGAPGSGTVPGCKGASSVFVSVCAADAQTSPGTAGAPGTVPAAAKKKPAPKPGKPPTCVYTRVEPQPPAGSPSWGGHKPGDKGAVFIAECDDTQTARPVWIADGAAPAAPAIDPEVVARRALDKARLDGPTIASPRTKGTYVIGMPMWMWATPTESTFGPTTATATAGAVTVTATAKVTSVAWNMGDGAVVTCYGPGTPYTKDQGKRMSPDCGHQYTQLARPLGQPYKGTATSTWTIDWKVVGGTGETGQFTEMRQTPFTAMLHEVQVLGTSVG